MPREDEVYDPHTAKREGKPLRRQVCRVIGHHDWTPWRRNASGWPQRECTFCHAAEVRLDPSW